MSDLKISNPVEDGPASDQSDSAGSQAGSHLTNSVSGGTTESAGSTVSEELPVPEAIKPQSLIVQLFERAGAHDAALHGGDNPELLRQQIPLIVFAEPQKDSIEATTIILSPNLLPGLVAQFPIMVTHRATGMSQLSGPLLFFMRQSSTAVEHLWLPPNFAMLTFDKLVYSHCQSAFNLTRPQLLEMPRTWSVRTPRTPRSPRSPLTGRTQQPATKCIAIDGRIKTYNEKFEAVTRDQARLVVNATVVFRIQYPERLGVLLSPLRNEPTAFAEDTATPLVPSSQSGLAELHGRTYGKTPGANDQLTIRHVASPQLRMIISLLKMSLRHGIQHEMARLTLWDLLKLEPGSDGLLDGASLSAGPLLSHLISAEFTNKLITHAEARLLPAGITVIGVYITSVKLRNTRDVKQMHRLAVRTIVNTQLLRYLLTPLEQLQGDHECSDPPIRIDAMHQPAAMPLRPIEAPRMSKSPTLLGIPGAVKRGGVSIVTGLGVGKEGGSPGVGLDTPGASGSQGRSGKSRLRRAKSVSVTRTVRLHPSGLEKSKHAAGAADESAAYVFPKITDPFIATNAFLVSTPSAAPVERKPRTTHITLVCADRPASAEMPGRAATEAAHLRFVQTHDRRIALPVIPVQVHPDRYEMASYHLPMRQRQLAHCVYVLVPDPSTLQTVLNSDGGAHFESKLHPDMAIVMLGGLVKMRHHDETWIIDRLSRLMDEYRAHAQVGGIDTLPDAKRVRRPSRSSALWSRIGRSGAAIKPPVAIGQHTPTSAKPHHPTATPGQGAGESPPDTGDGKPADSGSAHIMQSIFSILRPGFRRWRRTSQGGLPGDEDSNGGGSSVAMPLGVGVGIGPSTDSEAQTPQSAGADAAAPKTAVPSVEPLWKGNANPIARPELGAAESHKGLSDSLRILAQQLLRDGKRPEQQFPLVPLAGISLAPCEFPLLVGPIMSMELVPVYLEIVVKLRLTPAGARAVLFDLDPLVLAPLLKVLLHLALNALPLSTLLLTPLSGPFFLPAILQQDSPSQAAPVQDEPGTLLSTSPLVPHLATEQTLLARRCYQLLRWLPWENKRRTALSLEQLRIDPLASPRNIGEVPRKRALSAHGRARSVSIRKARKAPMHATPGHAPKPPVMEMLSPARARSRSSAQPGAGAKKMRARPTVVLSDVTAEKSNPRSLGPSLGAPGSKPGQLAKLQSPATTPGKDTAFSVVYRDTGEDAGHYSLNSTAIDQILRLLRVTVQLHSVSITRVALERRSKRYFEAHLAQLHGTPN